MLSNVKKVFWMTACLIIASSDICTSYKLLIVTPIASGSLPYLSRELGSILADAGHDVTLITSNTNGSGHPKVKIIHSGANLKLIEDTNAFDLQNTFTATSWMRLIIEEAAPIMWTNDEIISLWINRNSFDAIITSGFGNEIGAPFLIDFKGVHISLCTSSHEFRKISHYGHWLPISLVPDLNLHNEGGKTFFERFLYPVYFIYINYITHWTVYPAYQSVLHRFFPEMGPYDQLYFNISLFLINGHYAMDLPVPLLPNQIEIGTLTAKEPQLLPKDILDFVEGSGKNGLIYFNMGYSVKSKDIPKHYKQVLLNVFAKLPQRVLWKYEDTDLKLPPNIMTRKWLPQQDILGHPKTRIFISHCGNLATQEAKFHGVPILAMPITFDQHSNAVRITEKGFGLQIDWEALTEEALMEDLTQLINDTSFQQRIKIVSRILHDQKESPKELAVWWIEYAIRHKGAFHMTYAGKRLHFLQYILLDVISAWLLLLIVMIYVWYKFTLFISRKCISNKLKRKKD